MRTKLFSFIIVGTFLVTGVVSAYTEPAGSYPNGQVETVVHVGPEQQVKSGAFWAKLLQAGSKVTNTASLAGFAMSQTFTIAPSGFFTHVVLPGSNSQFRLGGVRTELKGVIENSETGSLFGYILNNLKKTTGNNVNQILDNNRAPLTIDLAGRGNKGAPASRDALAIISGGMCSQATAIITDASGISFRSDYNKNLSDANLRSDYADVLARQLRLHGGNPGENKVLVSVDRLGNATWGTLKFTPETEILPGLSTGACVRDPDYVGPPNQIACAAGIEQGCVPCGNITTMAACNSNGINSIHCKWDPTANTGPGTTRVVGMKVEVVYDKNSSPVRASQMMCGLEDPKEPIIGCTDPRYTQNGNYNANATQSGDCTCNTGYEFDSVAGKCEKPKSWKIITFTTPPPSEPPTKSGSSWQGCDVYWLDALRKSYGTNARFRVVGMTYNPNSPSDLAMISMYENQTIPENHPNFFIPINGLGSCLYRSEMGGGQGCYIHEMSKIPGVNNGNGTNPDVKRPPANNYAAKICRGYNINIETLDPFNPGGGNTTPTNSVSGYFLYQFQVYE